MIGNPSAASHRDVLLIDDDISDDTGSIWMLSYLDVMTLLVALFALLLSLTGIVPQTSEARPQAAEIRPWVDWQPAVELYRAVEQTSVEKWQAVVTLQDFLRRRALDNMQALAETKRPKVSAGEIAPGAVVTALGVARARPLTWVNSTGSLALVRRHRYVTQRINEVAVQGALAFNGVRSLPVEIKLDGIEITTTDQGMRLRIQEQLLFDTGLGDLSSSGDATVSQLLDIVARYNGKISVEGHTDNRSISTQYYPSNWELSTARATAIVRYFLDSGIDSARVRAIGYADTQPIASNETFEGRAANRRVEVILEL